MRCYVCNPEHPEDVNYNHNPACPNKPAPVPKSNVLVFKIKDLDS